MALPSEIPVLQTLVDDWRHRALVAGQFSVEGEWNSVAARAAGQAEVFRVCADALAAALVASSRTREAPRTDITHARELMKGWIEEDISAPPTPPPAPTPCEGDCNPYVSTCGAKFCTYEEMAAHERTCSALPAPPVEPERMNPRARQLHLS